MRKIILIAFIFLSFIVLLSCGKITTTTKITTTISTTTQVQTTTESPTTTQTPTTTNFTTIVDDEIYLVLLSGVDTVEINSEWVDAGAKIIINDQESDIVTTSTIDIETLGIYEIVYQYTYLSITYEISRYVIITDQTPPVIELNLGVDTIKVGNIWIDSGVTVTDNSEEEIEVTVNGTVDINTIGTYLITYTATDSSGNSSSGKRYVTVIE